jgi:hypothetical protein
MENSFENFKKSDLETSYAILMLLQCSCVKSDSSAVLSVCWIFSKTILVDFSPGIQAGAISFQLILNRINIVLIRLFLLWTKITCVSHFAKLKAHFAKLKANIYKFI